MNRKIILIALACFSISLLLLADNLESAYAFSTFVVNTNSANSSMAYNSTYKLYVTKDNSVADGRSVGTVNAQTGTFNTILLPDPETTAEYGTDIGCWGQLCYVAQNGASASKDFIIGFNPQTGTIVTNTTIGSLAGGLTTIQSSSNGIARDLAYFEAVCTTGSNRILISPVSNALGSCSGTNFGANNLFDGVYNGGDSFGVIFANSFSVWTISTSTRSCTTSITVGSSPLGTLAYYSNNWYGTVGSGSQVDQFTPSCTRTQNYITGHGLTTIRGVFFSTSLNGLFLVSSTATAVMNLTSSQFSTILYTISYGASISSTQNSQLASNMNQIGLANSSTFRVLQIDAIPSDTPSGGGSNGGIDCTDPDFSYRLICNLQDNSGLVGASNLINQSSTNIICQIGLLQCTQDEDGNFTPNDPDIQTNGIGYLLLAILIAIWVGIMWVASRGQLTEIPTFVWFIGIISIVGVITAFSWINPTFLIITVIAVAGFAVAKARGVFGGQIFAGESS